MSTKAGKTTVAELARGFGQVAPIAAEMGIELMDLQGRVIDMAYDNVLQEGNYLLPINTEKLENGFYLVNIEYNNQKEVLRLIKLK